MLADCLQAVSIIFITTQILKKTLYPLKPLTQTQHTDKVERRQFEIFCQIFFRCSCLYVIDRTRRSYELVLQHIRRYDTCCELHIGIYIVVIRELPLKALVNLRTLITYLRNLWIQSGVHGIKVHVRC